MCLVVFVVKGRAVPSVEVIHCLVWCVSVFKHAHIDAFVIVLLCVCVCVPTSVAEDLRSL